MQLSKRSLLAGLAGLTAAAATVPGTAQAASARKLNQQADHALRGLYASQPRAHKLGKAAKAILVFPDIVKAGFLVGAQTGDGVLIKGGRPVAYYNISAASYGLQAGVKTFSYALFLKNEAALKYLNDSDGWTVGTGPSIVVLDQGKAASMTSQTLTQDVIAVPFGQRGLMAGLGIEGSKITIIHPSP